MLYSTMRNLIVTLAVLIHLAGCGGSGDGDNSDAGQSQSLTISLAANPTIVGPNGSTSLNWSSANATSCTASGDWSGSKDLSGTETINSLTSDSHFILSCNDANGSVSDSVDVTIALNASGTALLSWTPPTQNTDGSALTDLVGYRIYYGTASGSYTETIDISNPGLASFLVENLTAADWYFAMTSLNSVGTESSYSTEVSKTIN